MARPQIVLNVRGGIVQDVFASNPDLQVVVVDWDTEGFESPALVELTLNGKRCTASVVTFPAQPLEELAGSDVEQAVDAACEQGLLCELV